MRCVECDSEKCDDERGWVTVLSPSGALRIHYCPDCMANLVSPSADAAEGGDHAKDE